MSHEVYKNLMMGYLDGELTELETARVERHLQACAECASEMQDFRKLKEITQPMKLAIPDETCWELYWSNVYNRLERRLGWLLFSIGVILTASYGLYRLSEHLLFDQDFPLLVRLGAAALFIGFCTLIVSVIRERIHHLKSDKYKRIKR